MSLDLKFQPEQKYDYMSDQELADLWRTMPLNNSQRYFMYKELKARNNSEALVNKNYANYFSLPEDETVILGYDENIVTAALGLYLFLFCSSPSWIVGTYVFIVEKILHQSVSDQLIGYWVLIQFVFWLPFLLRLISAEMVLTCKRLIVYLSFFAGTKRIQYSSHNFASNAVLICNRSLFRCQAPLDTYLYVDILNLKQNTTSRYTLKLKSGAAFLESVQGIAKENDCLTYIAPIVLNQIPSATGQAADVLYRFTGCTPEYLAEWFKELEASGVSRVMSPRYYYLADIAKYFAAADLPQAHEGLASEAKVASEKHITILKGHCSWWLNFNPKYVVLADKQIYLKNSKKKTIGSIPYSSAAATMSWERLRLSTVKGRIFRVWFYFSGIMPVLPVLDLYQLLGVSIKIKEVAA